MIIETDYAAWQDLGLTPLEVDAYRVLLVEPEPATGYRVAQALGKPPGAVYKALESLYAKGAVLVDDQEHRVYRATPFDEWIGQVSDRIERAAALLRPAATSPAGDPDDRVYQLATRAQALARARQMLAAAGQFVHATIGPDLVAGLEGDLQEAAGRGAFVATKLFEPRDIAGARVVLDARGREAFHDRFGQWLVLVVDGREALLALFDERGERLLQCFYTAGAFLAWTLFTGLISHLEIIVATDALRAGLPSERVLELVRELEPPGTERSAGRQQLVQRYRGPGQRGRPRS